MKKRVKWSISEVYKVLVLSQRVWKCLNHADWCAKVLLPPEESTKWHNEALIAIKELKEMGLSDLVDEIIKMRR